MKNSECEPGMLLRATKARATGYVFSFKQKGELFDFASGEELDTLYDEGDFFIWLQADCLLSQFCFCLHQRTGRVLCMLSSELEIVDLEELESNEPE